MCAEDPTSVVCVFSNLGVGCLSCESQVSWSISRKGQLPGDLLSAGEALWSGHLRLEREGPGASGGLETCPSAPAAFLLHLQHYLLPDDLKSPQESLPLAALSKFSLPLSLPTCMFG